MVQCALCGDGPGVLEYECSYCGLEFCQDHRQPEAHQCPELDEGDTWFDQDASSTNWRKKVHDTGGVKSDSGAVTPDQRDEQRRNSGVIDVSGGDDATVVGENDDDEGEEDEDEEEDGS